MSNASRLCTAVERAKGLSRMNMATSRISMPRSFSSGTFGGDIGPSKPRSSEATALRSLESPRGSHGNSPFPRTGDLSRLAKTFTRPALDSVRSPVTTDAHTKDGSALRIDQTPPSATGHSLTPLHSPPSSTPLSLDERQTTLNRDQYDKWAKKEIKEGRISRQSEGGVTSRRA